MASKPVPQQYRKAYQDLTGGLMSRPNPLQIPANKFAFLQNAILNDHDVLEKVEGYTLDGSPFPSQPDAFIRLLVNYKIGDTISTLVCAAADTVHNSDATFNVDLKQSYGDGNYNYIGHTIGTAQFTTGSTAVVGLGTDWDKHLKAGDQIGTGVQPSTWYKVQSVNSATSITLTSNYLETTTTSVGYMARIMLSVNNIPVGVVFNNNLIISNGSETPMQTNNVSLDKLQSPNWPTVNLLELHKNRVFGANWPSQPSGLMWTYSNDQTTVDPVSFASVFPNDNGQTVQIKSFANSLLVFKDNGYVYQVVGEFDQNAQGQPALIRRLDCPDNVGVISGKSVCVLEDSTSNQGYQRLGSKVYFLAETGIYSINAYMQVQKVSWDIQPTLANLLLKSTATATKQFAFTSKSQWDTGMINSLSDTFVLNGMSTFFSSQNINSAYNGNGAASTFMAPNNDVHTAYISSDRQSVRYNHWLASDQSITDTQVIKIGVDTIVTSTYPNILTIDSVAIAVSGSGNVGIVFKTHQPERNSGGSGPGTPIYFFSEFISGAWAHTHIFEVNQTDENPQGHGVQSLGYDPLAVGLSVIYSGNNPTVVLGQGNQSQSNGGVVFFIGHGITQITRTTGVWGNQNVLGANIIYTATTFKFDSNSHLHVVGTFSSNVDYWTSSNGGGTWTNPKTIVVSGTSPLIGAGNINVEFTNLSDPIIIYNFTSGTGGDVGKIVRYNVTSTATTYIDTGPTYLQGYASNSNLLDFVYTITGGQEKFEFQTSYQGGTAILTNGSTNVVGTATKWTTWVQPGDQIKVLIDEEVDYATVLTVNSDNSITLSSSYGGTTQVTAAAYISRRWNTVTSTSAPIATNTFFTGSSGLSNNANAIASVCFSLNANQLIVRRLTLWGQWSSQILSDSSLTVWGTYSVVNPVSNGNTITYEVGVSSGNAMPDNQLFPVIPGSIISATNTDIFVEARITFILSNFAPSSVQSLTLNYVGAGVDAKLPFGYVFNNEMYLSVTTPQGSGNNEMIFLDRIGSWGTFTAGSCAMARYNQQLYVGDSITGNIYKFRQGFDFNGSAYSLIAITKEDLLGSIELQKEIYKVYVIYETQSNGTFKFSYRFDNFLNPNSDNTTGWVDATIDQTKGAVFEIDGMSGQKCSSIQFKVEQDDADVQLGLIGFIVLYDYYGLR